MPHQTFQEWFNAQGFKHFTAEEIASYFKRYRNGVSNSAPNPALWPHIVPTLRVVDELREHLGKPITILSSYRSPAYNRAIGGAPLSQHLEFSALDITSKDIPAKSIHAVLKEWRKAGKFKGGLGLYEKSNFVHIDTRGHNADWIG